MEKELADEVYMKNCSNCGRRIEKPVLCRGYVFCSDSCRESFISTHSPS